MVRQVMALACAGLVSVTVGVSTPRAQSSAARPGGQPAPAAATRDDAATPDVASPVDQQFVVQAALANMAEVQLGHLATEKAKRSDIKKFAQAMIDDHLKAQQELADAAQGAGIKWPKQLDEGHQRLRQHLSSVTKDEFDHEYVKAVVDAHRDVESLLNARVKEGGGPGADGKRTRSSAATQSDDSAVSVKVNEWAAKTLPSVRAQLKEAEQVFGELDKGK